MADLLRAHNEHRIVWTRALDLLLFAVNRQWDPLLQLMAGAGLWAAGLAGCVAADAGWGVACAVTAGVTLGFLPHLAWHNALWGLQSQVYFALLFTVMKLALLSGPAASLRRRLTGLAAGAAALLAMGPAALAPVAVLGVPFLRVVEQRRWSAARWREFWPALVLLAAGLILRVLRRRTAAPGEDFVVLAGWVGLSAEVMRGLVVPRWQDREAPVRLMRAYQLTGDEKVFAAQPRLYVPYPNLPPVRGALGHGKR